MHSIIVISQDPAVKAAIESKLQKSGFPVETSAFTPEPRGEIAVHLTTEATSKLLALDATLVGTPHYMGAAYFWSHEYRHYLRDATTAQRCAVHDHWLAEGLPLLGESDRHLAIIRTITGKH